MWLDAFIKPNSTDMQKVGVSGVSRVNAHCKPNEYKDLEEAHHIDTRTKAQCQSVSVVSNEINRSNQLTQLTPTDTTTKTTCEDRETPRKANEYKDLDDRLTPLTPLTPRKHNALETKAPSLETLKQFRFDLVQIEIEDGYPADELHRVNNMAWELMQTNGMSFDEAIKKAGKIVANCQITACETAYLDVMALFKRMKSKINSK